MEDIGVNNTLNELRTFIDTCQIISRLVQQAHNNELPIIDCSNVIQMAEFTMQFNVDEKTNETKITNQFAPSPRKRYISTSYFRKKLKRSNRQSFVLFYIISGRIKIIFVPSDPRGYREFQRKLK